MKLKKWCVSVLALLCFGFLFGGVMAFAEDAAPVYTKIESLEGHIEASSTYNDDSLAYELSKLANSGRGIWRAQWGYTSNPSADEWIQIDLQETKTIGKVVLHNEEGKAYARKFVVFGSLDGQAWFELARYEGGDSDWSDDNTVELVFDAAQARYVKVSLREKGLDGTNYLVGMSEIEIFETDQPATAQQRPYTEIEADVIPDATLDGSDAALLTDGITADQTSTAPYWTGGWKSAAATDTDEIVFDAGEVISFGGISLFPRCATTSSSVPCSVSGFPRAFAIYSSVDGAEYTLVKGQEYSDYEADLSWNDFLFDRPVQARYVKFAVTERGVDAGGTSYLTQLAEAKAYRADFEVSLEYTLVKPQSAEASGSWDDGHAPENAYDGSYSTSWVAPWGYAAHRYADESITYDLGESKVIGRIDYHVSDVNVPNSFRVLVSEDGENWGVLFRQDSPQYAEGVLSVIFDSVSARFVKTEVYEKGANGSNYLAGFTEIEVYETDEEEAYAAVEYLTELTGQASVAVTSTQDPNTPDKLTNGLTANTNAQSDYWMTTPSASAEVDGSATATGFDGFYFSFAEVTEVDSLWLFPRFDGVPGSAIGFPADFSVVYSQNGQEWYEIASYTDYQVQAGWNEFRFPGRVSAKYIGVYVRERGMNGDLYTIEMAEAKLFRAQGDRSAMTGDLILDSSRITVTPYEPADFIYTWQEFSLDLSQHFSYSLPGELEYTVESGGGAIEMRDGVPCYVLTPETTGSVAVKISAHPEGKTAPSASLEFTLTVSTQDDPDVIARSFAPDMVYAVGVTFRVNVEELFVYEGSGTLVYTAQNGSVESVGEVTYFVFTPSAAGEIELSVTAQVDGREDKKATSTFTLTVTEAPAAEPEQPPVYGPAEPEGGCNSSLAGGALAASAVLLGAAAAAIALIRRKKI